MQSVSVSVRDVQGEYVLPHRDIRCRSNLLSHLVTVYCHQANTQAYSIF